MFGDGAMVGSGRDGDKLAQLGCGGDIDGVETDPHAGDHFQLGMRLENSAGVRFTAGDYRIHAFE